jgi:hypothetical protein
MADELSKKIKLVIDDPETRAIWESVKRAAAEVKSWPAWKRGECPCCRFEYLA